MKGARPTQADIDLDALSSNYQVAQRLAAGREVIAVVKANAYGHGAVPVARRLAAAGCECLAVATVAEAAGLRSAAVSVQILILGGIHGPAEASDVVELESTPVVQRREDVGLLSQAARERELELPVQMEVDTGMRRLGLPNAQALDCAAEIAAAPGLLLDGVYTHLARADEADPEPSLAQLRQFSGFVAGLRAQGISPGQVHVANSAALLSGMVRDSLGAEITAVRPGLLLYGAAPSPTLSAAAAESALRPVMRLSSRLVSLRRVEAGDGVGYGATYRAKSPRTIGTLPIGYADGLPRDAGGRAFVFHRGRHVPMVGVVSMDFVTVDLGDTPAEIGDEVVIFGPELGVEALAEAVGTIPYELLVRVGERVPRVVT